MDVDVADRSPPAVATAIAMAQSNLINGCVLYGLTPVI